MSSAELDDLIAERAIRDRLCQYAWAIDHHDADGFADSFTEDGVFEVVNAGLGSGARLVRGRAALRGYVAAHPEPDPTSALKHMNLNVRIEITGSTAKSQSYFMSVKSEPETGPYVQTFGVFEDTFAKGEDDVWRISHRLFRSEAAIPKLRELPKHYDEFRPEATS